MKYLVMTGGVAILGMIWAVMTNCPAFTLFMLPCLIFSGVLLYLEAKGEFDE